MKKNYLLTLLAAMLLCLGMSSVAMAAEPGIISVEGAGEYVAAPDKAMVTFSVESSGKTVQLAQADNAAKASRVSAALSRQGIYNKDIQSHYNLQPVYDRKDYSRITGYTAENTFTVTVNDIGKLGDVIDAALANGATGVSGCSYGLKDETGARNEAIRQAVADARSKADAIASALGVNIIGVRSVTENSGGRSLYRLEAVSLMRADNDAAPSTPVSPGTINISSNVHIEYQIQ